MHSTILILILYNKIKLYFAVRLKIDISLSDVHQTVPVTAVILLPKGRIHSVGTDISLYCNVTGEPTPDVTWYKDNRPIEVSNRLENPGDTIILE